ncbi:MAG: hypothetical protein OXN21_11740, partial [Chloroflexota bacterium]|nr:hypothetical protein [Chloroflexota bacterium]
MSSQLQYSPENWAAANLGHLRFLVEEEGSGVRAALLVTNCHGEPLEFCYTRVDLPAGALWEFDAAYRRAVAGLALALFEEVKHPLDLALVLADEAPPDLFSSGPPVRYAIGMVDGAVDPPVCWLGTEPESSLAA